MIIEFLADGFEEIEALTPVDILRRAGCDVKCVSVNKTKTVVGAHGIKVEADITAEEAERLALSPRDDNTSGRNAGREKPRRERCG